jgi:hypothetical protein
VPPDDVLEIKNKILLVTCGASELKQQVSHLCDATHSIFLEGTFGSKRKNQRKRARQGRCSVSEFVLCVTLRQRQTGHTLGDHPRLLGVVSSGRHVIVTGVKRHPIDSVISAVIAHIRHIADACFNGGR